MEERKPTLLQKLNKIRKAITVEPAIFLMITGLVLASTATQILTLDKTCRVNLKLPEHVCNALRNQNSSDMSDFEKIVQEHVANLYAYRSIITSVLPCIILVFAGGWMDLTGRRKIMMILPSIAETLVQVSFIINVILFYQLKVEFLIFSEAVLTSMFGSWNMIFLAILSYISDITTEKNRTLRLGMVTFCVSIAMPLGMFLSGHLLRRFGYLTVYIISVSLAVSNLAYIICVMSDPERTKEQKMHDNRGVIYFMKSFFSLSHFLNSIKTVFKKTENNRATLLCIFIVIAFFLAAPTSGEAAIMFMSLRYRFNWDEVQFSTFQTVNFLLSVVGTALSILIFIQKLKWHDTVLGILSTSSKIVGAFMYCFASSGWMFYLGPVLDILSGTSSIAIKSIVSKSVEPSEIAKTNSILVIVEVLTPLAAISLYTQVYTATLSTLPGAVFLVGIGLTIPPLLLFSWLFYKHRQSLSSNFSETEKHNII